MLPIGILLALLGLALGAPSQSPLPSTNAPNACPKNVTLTPDGYTYYPVPLPSADQCLSYFTVPAGFYVKVYVRLYGAESRENVLVYDNFRDEYFLDVKFCPNCNGTIDGSANFPTDFVIEAITQENSKMSFYLNITVTPANPNANVVSTTQLKKNGQPSLVYFQDFQPGTSYKFTAENDVILRVAPGNNAGDPSDLQSAFVYNGDNLVSTLGGGNIALIKGQVITIYLVEKIAMKGAVLLTDSSNINELVNYQVEYVPLEYPTAYAPLNGFGSRMGATTIIGEKDGSTPIDVRQLVTYEGGSISTFYSLPGGPLADHSAAVKMSPNKLPQHFGGNLNTFLMTGGMGSIKYSVGGN